MGRPFAAGEDQAGHDHVVILSHGLWERRFGSDPSVVGRTVRLDRENYEVVGSWRRISGCWVLRRSYGRR